MDDEESIRRYVCLILSKQYRILVADSGEAAFEQSRSFSGPIQLMLSNVQMPGISGVELGTKLNFERPDMKVLLMSGFTSGMLILNEGWHFLHKPFVPSQLLDLVKSVLQAPPLDQADLDEHSHSDSLR